VFLHVNDLLIPESLVRPGITVMFDVDEGDHGLKASNIQLPPDGTAQASRSSRRVRRWQAWPRSAAGPPAEPLPVIRLRAPTSGKRAQSVALHQGTCASGP
jgi:cold shock protein